MSICQSCQTENEKEVKFCKNCGSKLNTILMKEVTFAKHLFNWKYYIVVIIFSIALGLHYGAVGGAFFESDAMNGMNSIAFFTSVFIVIKYKNGAILKRIGMFFASYLVTALSFSIIFGVVSAITIKVAGNSIDTYITNLLSANSKLPIKMNDEMMIMKFERGGQDRIKQYVKFMNYDKNEILADYQNNIQTAQNESLHEELKASCPVANTREMLEAGLILELVYQDKYDATMFSIVIDNEKCLPFYNKNGK